MSYLVAPSVLAADFLHLERDISMVNESEADWLHVDVMDGVFVPNISFGQSIIKKMNEVSTIPLDVHLMIVKPEQYVQSFRDVGAEVLTVHVEACDHLHRVIQQIKATGAQAGVAINPHTPISSVENVIDDIDLVCLMSVNPGFGGQKFIPRTIDKIHQLKAMINSRKANVLIEIDGGVGLQNAESIIQAGADVLVAGSSVFKSSDPNQTISQMKKIDVKNFVV